MKILSSGNVLLCGTIVAVSLFLAGCQAPAQTGGIAQPDATKNTSQNESITQSATETELQAKKEEEKKKLQEDSARLQTVMDKGDISQCSTINDANWRNDCIYNITVKKVNETGDKTLCDTIEDPMRRQFCTGEFVPSTQ